MTGTIGDARKRRVGASDDQGDRQGGESRSTVAFCGSGGMNYIDLVPAKPLERQECDLVRVLITRGHIISSDTIERLLATLEAAERDRDELRAKVADLEGLLAEPRAALRGDA